MKVRHKKTDIKGTSSQFNQMGIGEIIIAFEDGSMDSDFIREYDVLIKGVRWVDMKEAFSKNWLIPDNYDRNFREPRTVEEQERGWY